MNVTDIPNRVQSTGDDLVGYDRGDLLTDIDRQIGDAIERTVNRYHSRDIAKALRKSTVQELGDKIITFDRVQKEAQTQT